jgi:hypothetical protein
MCHLFRFLVVAIFIVGNFSAEAQLFKPINRKGQLYFGWGWNRAHYSNSDIHFTGDNYDFTLLDVSANDRQSEFDAELYFNPGTITIPQTNMRLGYFLTDKIALSFGVDHMKYVMVNWVDVNIEGTLPNDDYSDLLHDGDIYLHPKFLKFEHTDGLNYINSELEYFENVYQKPKFQFNTFAGAGLGAIVPKTNVTLMGYPRHDAFHLAGYGVDIKLGFEMIFFKYFFIKAELKKGFINMPDIITRSDDYNDRASQHFFFTEMVGMFGVNYPINQGKQKGSE